MNTNIKNRTSMGNGHLLPALAAGLLLALAGRTPAQTFTNLYSFTAWSTGPAGGDTNRDGRLPQDGLFLSGNSLYGTTTSGGFFGGGTVFQISTDGTSFTNIHNFPDGNYSSAPWPGWYPRAGVILSSNTLYGTTSYGGVSDYSIGTVFKVNTDGTGFLVLHTFNGSDGYDPQAGLMLSGNSVFGTTQSGGAAYNGTVFRVNTDDTDFTNLHSFTALVSGTNSDGEQPYAGLVVVSNVLYGATAAGGVFSHGTLFKMGLDGSGFTVIHNFAGDGSEGFVPMAALIASGGILYGTASGGGNGSGSGTVFKVRTDGLQFMTLHTFSGSDGKSPQGRLYLAGNTLYGTTYLGGAHNVGTVFQVNTDGSGFTNLFHFTGSSDGGNPDGGLVLSGDKLYGMTRNGGDFGQGTVFSLSVASAGPPKLEVGASGENLTIAWPASATDFTLQTNADLTPSGWSDYGGTISTNGDTLNVTVTPTAGNLFFRLSNPAP